MTQAFDTTPLLHCVVGVLKRRLMLKSGKRYQVRDQRFFIVLAFLKIGLETAFKRYMCKQHPDSLFEIDMRNLLSNFGINFDRMWNCL